MTLSRSAAHLPANAVIDFNAGRLLRRVFGQEAEFLGKMPFLGKAPVEYRFEGSEVYVRRDPVTGDVILSRRPESWKDFFELMRTVDVPEDFLSDRQDAPPQKRKLF